jgi:aquaporin Z
MHSNPQRLAAEFFGTFWLVFGGCGTAVLASQNVQWLGVSFAFGLTVLTMAYAVGHVSGAHFNPAVTVGLAMCRRLARIEVPGYVLVQVTAAFVLWVVAHGVAGFDSTETGFASNGYGERSPMGYDWWAVMIIEVLLTAFFLYVILGVTDTRAPKGFAPIAIGLTLTLIHLVSIPVSNTSVNPARSIGPALFAGGDAIWQLWLFILAPLIGGLVAGATYRALFGDGEPTTPLEVATEG